MHCDWDQKVLKFRHKGVWVTLKGDASQHQNCIQDVSVLQVHKWLKGNEVWAFVLLETVEDTNNCELKEELQNLLVEFDDLFAVPQQLPPSR
jgi:acyl-coenzyme A synthetase/AMP-(fatty) acid ligase